MAAVSATQRKRTTFKIGQLGNRPAARRDDDGRPAEIGIAHRDRPAAVIAPGIGLQIGEIGIPRYVNARHRVRGRGQQRGNLHLVALEQHDLDRKMGFLMEVTSHAFPDRYHLRIVRDGSYPDCSAHGCLPG
jgi:hypothetical protein